MDEPDLKARLTLNLGHASTVHGLSNMEATGTSAIPGMDGYVMDTFSTSQAMSTYLFAISISDFVFSSTYDDRVSIWHRQGMEESATHAADIAPKIMNYYEYFLNVPYSLPKVDHVILPDFATVGMENWGMITYDEKTTLVNEKQSSYKDIDLATHIVAHELAHMWYGDLITMTKWDDMFLNEGFATFLEQKGMDYVDPDLRAQEKCLLGYNHPAMATDAVPDATKAVSRPIDNARYQNVLAPHVITYFKGAGILRMVEFILGKETMRKGMHNYLVANAYGNVGQTDLWNALNEVGVEDGVFDDTFDLNVAMDAWINQPGFPVVTVVDNQAGTLALEQKQFFIYPADAEQADGTLWQVPLTLSYPGSDAYETMWMTTESTSLTITQTPYIINFDAKGFYRVNYDQSNWEALAANMNLDLDDIGHLNRAQLYDDSLNLARAGLLPYNVALDVARSLISETEYLPLESGLEGLSYLGIMFRNNSRIYSDFKSFMTATLLPNYNSLTFDEAEGDDYFTILRRDTVIKNMCLYGYQDCIDKVSNLFSDWKRSSNPDVDNPINPNLRETVYQVAARSAESRDYEFLLDRLTSAGAYGITQESEKILKALGNMADEELLLELLQLTITEESPIRKLDANLVYSSVGRTVEGRNLQLSWLVDNYNPIKEYFGEDAFGGNVLAMLGSFGADSNFPSDISELESFIGTFKDDLGKDVTGELELGLMMARRNEEWVEANFADILSWLESQSGQDSQISKDLKEGSSLDLALSVSKPDRAVIGSEAEISCLLGGEEVILGETCSWKTPEGASLQADLSSGAVTNSDTGESVEGMTAFGDDSDKTCGLLIGQVAENDLGDWTCVINEDQDGVPFHEGTFALLSEGHVIDDMRLPRWLQMVFQIAMQAWKNQ